MAHKRIMDRGAMVVIVVIIIIIVMVLIVFVVAMAVNHHRGDAGSRRARSIRD